MKVRYIVGTVIFLATGTFALIFGFAIQVAIWIECVGFFGENPPCANEPLRWLGTAIGWLAALAIPVFATRWTVGKIPSNQP